MARKTTHTCERCGHETQQNYAGSFRDDDYRELLHDYLVMEAELRSTQARESYWQASCHYARQEVRLVGGQLADAYTDIGERAAQALSDCPF